MPRPDTKRLILKKWSAEGKPGTIAGSFSKVSELTETHIKHFRSAKYLLKPLGGGTIWGAILMDDALPYIHQVLMTEEVVEYILKLKNENK